jgi:hemolysin III
VSDNSNISRDRSISRPGPTTQSARFVSAAPPREAEQVADIRVLSFGLVCSILAVAALLAVAISRRDTRVVLGATVYAAGLIAMLGCSLLYRAAREPRRRQFWRRIDHAAIFAMIAGSATPFALARGGVHGAVVMAALWGAAVTGMIAKLSFPVGNVRYWAWVYLVLGWACLFALGPAVSRAALMLITAGGVFYSAGVLFLLWRRLRYRLAVWHLFVLAGATCHYLAILFGIVFA